MKQHEENGQSASSTAGKYLIVDLCKPGLEMPGPQVSKCACQSPNQSWDGNREH